MGIFDSILGSVGGTDLENLAAKVGIDPSMAEKAVAALGAAHVKEGNTVKTAAAHTGLGRPVSVRETTPPAKLSTGKNVPCRLATAGHTIAHVGTFPPLGYRP